jgi:hypothetical protein
MAWFLTFLVIVVWNLISRWPIDWWWNYLMIAVIFLPLAIGLVTTVWLGWGGLRDLGRLFRRLSSVRRDESDDGEVVNEER